MALTELNDYHHEKLAWICWRLWNRRNALLHGNFIKSDAILLDYISHFHSEYKESVVVSVPHRQPRDRQYWSPPQGDMFKINVDASHKPGIPKVGVGVVVRNASGELLGALTKPYVASWSILHAELIGICEAIIFCMEAGFNYGSIVSDYYNAINLVTSASGGDHLDPSCFLVEEIKDLLSVHANLVFF